MHDWVGTGIECEQCEINKKEDRRMGKYMYGSPEEKILSLVEKYGPVQVLKWFNDAESKFIKADQERKQKEFEAERDHLIKQVREGYEAQGKLTKLMDKHSIIPRDQGDL